jgi:hypothetical protein
MTHLNANANLKPSLRQLIPSPRGLSKCIKLLVLETSKMYRFLRAKQTYTHTHTHTHTHTYIYIYIYIYIYATQISWRVRSSTNPSNGTTVLIMLNRTVARTLKLSGAPDFYFWYTDPKLDTDCACALERRKVLMWSFKCSSLNFNRNFSSSLSKIVQYQISLTFWHRSFTFKF